MHRAFDVLPYLHAEILLQNLMAHIPFPKALHWSYQFTLKSLCSFWHILYLWDMEKFLYWQKENVKISLTFIVEFRYFIISAKTRLNKMTLYKGAVHRVLCYIYCWVCLLLNKKSWLRILGGGAKDKCIISWMYSSPCLYITIL